MLPVPLPQWHGSRFSIALGFLVFGLAAAIWLAHIPVVVRRLELEPGLLGSILFASSLVALVANGFWGRMTVRLGSRLVVWLMMPLFMTTVTLSISAPSITVLILVALAGGIAATGLNISLSTQAADYEKRSGLSVMPWFHSLFSIGGIIGGLAGAGLIRLGYGNGSGAAMMLLVVVLAFLLAGRSLLQDQPTAEDRVSIWTAMRHPGIVLLAVIILCADFTECTVNDWGALLLSRMEGMTEALAALGFAIYSASIAAARLVGGLLVSRFGDKWVLATGGFLIAMGAGLVILAPTAMIAIAGFIMIALGGANMIPILMSRGAQSGVVAPSVAIAALSTAQGLGFLASPPVVGSVSQFLGLSAGMGVLTVVGAIALVTTLYAFRHKRPA